MPVVINRVPEKHLRCIINVGLANHIKHNGERLSQTTSRAGGTDLVTIDKLKKRN
jgi:hypothetical protein